MQKALPRGLVDVLTRHREESFGLWCGRSTAIVGRVEELFLDVVRQYTCLHHILRRYCS